MGAAAVEGTRSGAGTGSTAATEGVVQQPVVVRVVRPLDEAEAELVLVVLELVP